MGARRAPNDDVRSLVSFGRRQGAQHLKPLSLNLSVFKGVDFHLWRTDAEFILNLNGHWDIIQGKFLKPKIDERGHIFLGPDFRTWGTMEDVDEWDALNRQALAILYNSLGPDQKQLVSRCKEASEMWRILEETYSRKSTSNLAHILKQYNSFKMRKGQTMESYIREYKGHLDRLRDIGVQHDEKVVVLNLLNGLRDEYAIDRKIMSRNNDLSYDEAVGQLLSESLLERSVSSGPVLGNLTEADSKKGKGRGKGKGEKVCYHCGQKGHVKPSCPDLDKYESGACYNCHKMGHLSAKCPKKKGGSGGQPRANMTQGGSAATSSKEGPSPSS